MAGISYRLNKKTGTIYVYSINSYWDREKKAPRNKQVCLGKLDPETKEVVPSKRKRTSKPVEEKFAATARVAGPFLLLNSFAEQSGLSVVLKRCFPDRHNDILSLVFFIVQKGLPLSRCEFWSNGNLHPAGKIISSQRVSELLLEVTEEDRQRFISLWMAKIAERDYLCYDITSISSYVQGNEFIRFGYNRDGEALPQLNLAMLFGQKSKLPAWYRRMQGNISDVATLTVTLATMDFLGACRLHLIMDRGFYSKANVDELLKRRCNFTMAVPSGRKWVESLIDLHYEAIASPEHYIEVNDKEALYAATSLYKWDQRRTYLHVYYNAARAAEDFDRLIRKLLRCKKELESGKRAASNEEYYTRFFTVKETPKRGLRVNFNETEIQKYRKRYAGFFCILSTQVREATEALKIYRSKEIVENCFDDLKNQLDMKRLRVHSSAAMDSRIFLQFLALILISQIRETIHGNRELWNLTVREVMEAMESLTRITYASRYGQVYTETSPLQRKIMEAFSITLPT